MPEVWVAYGEKGGESGRPQYAKKKKKKYKTEPAIREGMNKEHVRGETT